MSEDIKIIASLKQLKQLCSAITDLASKADESRLFAFTLESEGKEITASRIYQSFLLRIPASVFTVTDSSIPQLEIRLDTLLAITKLFPETEAIPLTKTGLIKQLKWGQQVIKVNCISTSDKEKLLFLPLPLFNSRVRIIRDNLIVTCGDS